MNWSEIIDKESKKDYYKSLKAKISEEYSKYTIYPEYKDIFRALNICSFENVKVVILGQDPYINKDEAQGLAFSTPSFVKNPPSVKNIFKEIESDLGYPSNCLDGDLTNWGEQGVLLLNSILTVRSGESNSHAKLGWHIFTDAVIKTLSDNSDKIVFILWGGKAKLKRKLIDEDKHLVITGTHPSPLGANKGGFFGSKPFSQANAFLIKHNKKPIQW